MQDAYGAHGYVAHSHGVPFVVVMALTVRRTPMALNNFTTVSNCGLLPAAIALYTASRPIPAARAMALTPSALMTLSNAASSLSVSPVASAFDRYAATACFGVV